MQRLYRWRLGIQHLYGRRPSACSLYDADYSIKGIRIPVGPESEKLDFQICVDLEFPRYLP
jgi:hypothetical protein